MRVKSIYYAYPTSTAAEARNRGAVGCYYVTTREGCELATESPATHDTTGAAESEADTMEMPWDAMYLRHPLRGSRFFPVNA